MPRIAIVGAGIAGLNAALTLQGAGFSCSIYEASNRIGGRMHSDAITWADGMVSEWCGEFIDGDHETMHQLIKRFGLHTIDLGQGRADQTQSIMYLFNRYYDAEELAGDFQAFASLLQQQVQAVDFPTTHDRFTQTGFRLDHLSIYDWIEQYIEGGHDAPMGHMLDAACTGFYGLDTDKQSSLNLVYMFGSRDQSKGSITSKSLQGSSKILGGNEQLPLAIARSLDDSANIQSYAQNCLQQLERVFPSISTHYTGRAALSYSTGDPYLLGSYACWRVGQYTQFGGYEGVSQGPIHFAGEHCSVEFQGFMEGAAREGARAAGEIVQDLGEKEIE